MQSVTFRRCKVIYYFTYKQEVTNLKVTFAEKQEFKNEEKKKKLIMT